MNILWDFDGTLFDTYAIFTRIAKQVLNNQVSEEEIFAQLKVSFSHAIQYYHLSNAQMEQFVDLREQVQPKDFKPFKGVEEILKFADQNVIMTHSSRAEVLKILRHYGWEKYFIEIVTSDNGFPRKPDSSAYEYLHQRHSIDLAIGDRLLDIIPAKKLGIKTCLFQNSETGADFYLDSYENFFEVVGSQDSVLKKGK